MCVTLATITHICVVECESILGSIQEKSLTSVFIVTTFVRERNTFIRIPEYTQVRNHINVIFVISKAHSHQI
jgi:hypothetical protein